MNPIVKTGQIQLLQILLFTVITGCADSVTPSIAAAQPECRYTTRGTSVPNSSGTPTVIDNVTGTVISANFFDSGAIDPPFFDGNEFVTVCISPPTEDGQITGSITTDVGLDDDTRIKGYPEIIIGTKFGNIYETSFRYYSNIGLPAEQQWPIVTSNKSADGTPFTLANLEYVSTTRQVRLPAFTNNLPNIKIQLNIDELNVRGAERDVMLESWFHDTSLNAALIGVNAANGAPIAGTLNNIVGIGHPHYSELDNTLLEMMVHIGPLSANDASESNRNPGQNQLTENFSGKDFDGDGIDDHFDVDSHVNKNTNLDPNPGIYSSGIDEDGDGVDDADILPVLIGNHMYSIWYGTSFLAPIVIYSRETTATVEKDLTSTNTNMSLSSEGDIELYWNDFLTYTLYSLEPLLKNKNVSWVTGDTNPFPAMRSAAGAISGLEFGIEPQTNNPADLPYTAIVNKYNVDIDGVSFGLSDGNSPRAVVFYPEPEQAVLPETHDILINAYDSGSGIDRVRVRVQRLGVSPAQFWNGSAWSTTSAFPDAELNTDGTAWTLPNVDLTAPGRYRVRVNAIDNAGNAARAFDNPKTDFSVGTPDTTSPSAQATTPANGESIDPTISALSGISSDPDSGVQAVRVRVQRLGVSPILFWNGTEWTTTSAFTDAELNTDGTAWTLPNVDLTAPGRYRVRVNAIDNAGNAARAFDNPKTDFLVLANDSTNPTGAVTAPANRSSVPAGLTDIQGTANDNESGISQVKVRVQRLGTSPALYWNGNSWERAKVLLDATLGTDATSWTLPGVNLDTPARYRIRIQMEDLAGNTSGIFQNSRTDFTVN